MKKFKKLIPALCMLLISAVLMGTSTYAWFSMNKTVVASGMKVQARAEGGIVIGRTVNATEGTFTAEQRKALSTSVTLVTPDTADKLLPTSTADCTSWYHSDAKEANASTSTGTYEELNKNTKWVKQDPTADKSGYGYVDPTTTAGDELYYFVWDKISVVPDAQSSSFEDLWIRSCTVTSTNALSQSLRVAVVCGDTKIILAPVTGGSTSYKVNGATAVTAVNTATTGTTPFATISAAKSGNVALVEGSKTQVDIVIYVYFEGEDSNHYTDNYTQALTTALDSLSISISFACTSVAAGA